MKLYLQAAVSVTSPVLYMAIPYRAGKNSKYLLNLQTEKMVKVKKKHTHYEIWIFYLPSQKIHLSWQVDYSNLVVGPWFLYWHFKGQIILKDVNVTNLVITVLIIEEWSGAIFTFSYKKKSFSIWKSLEILSLLDRILFSFVFNLLETGLVL